MSPRIADLGDVLAHTAWATPAPTAAGPGDPPTVPWPDTGPRVTDEDTYRAYLDGLTRDELIAEIRRGDAELAAVIARHRALGEVA